MHRVTRDDDVLRATDAARLDTSWFATSSPLVARAWFEWTDDSDYMWAYNGRGRLQLLARPGDVTG